MDNYRFVIEYDGSRYNGWQRLKASENTIQGKLEAVLSEMTGEQIAVTGAGRTDAGVHAKAQVANAFLNTDKTLSEIKAYLNKYLPADIRVLSAERAAERFHSRFNAVSKTYCYYISTAEKPSVFERKYVYHLGFTPDLEKMKEAAKGLIGTHDFTSFCGNKRMKKSSVRTVSAIDISFDKEREIIKIAYTGDGFLQYMIRIMTGTLLEAGLGRIEPSSVHGILSLKDRSAAGYTAPACGLFLESVSYEAR